MSGHPAVQDAVGLMNLRADLDLQDDFSGERSTTSMPSSLLTSLPSLIRFIRSSCISTV